MEKFVLGVDLTGRWKILLICQFSGVVRRFLKRTVIAVTHSRGF
jgi:hypothetical protein